MVKINNNIRGLKLNYGSDIRPKKSDNLKVKRRQTNKGYSYILDNKGHVEFIVLDSEPYRKYDYILINPKTGNTRPRYDQNLTIKEFEDRLKKGLLYISGGDLNSKYRKNPSRNIMAEYRSRKALKQVDWYLIPLMEYKAKKYNYFGRSDD